MKNIKNVKYIKELKALGYPLNEMLVVGSGTMSLYGLKENKDLDLWVTKKVFDKMTKDKRFIPNDRMLQTKDGSIEADYRFVCVKQMVEEYLQRAEVVQGVHFQNLYDVLDWKKCMSRPKDIEDIKIIENYLKNNVLEVFKMQPTVTTYLMAIQEKEFFALMEKQYLEEGIDILAASKKIEEIYSSTINLLKTQYNANIEPVLNKIQSYAKKGAKIIQDGFEKKTAPNIVAKQIKEITDKVAFDLSEFLSGFVIGATGGFILLVFVQQFIDTMLSLAFPGPISRVLIIILFGPIVEETYKMIFAKISKDAPSYSSGMVWGAFSREAIGFIVNMIISGVKISSAIKIRLWGLITHMASFYLYKFVEDKYKDHEKYKWIQIGAFMIGLAEHMLWNSNAFGYTNKVMSVLKIKP